MSKSFWYGLGGAVMFCCALQLATDGEFLLTVGALIMSYCLVKLAVDSDRTD